MAFVRRSIVVFASVLLAASALAEGPVPAVRDTLAEARQILAASPLIDGHNDIAEQLRGRFANHLDRVDLKADLSTLDPPMHTDIPRLRRGQVGGEFWSVYVSTDLQGPAAVQTLFEQIDVMRRVIARYPDTFEMASKAADIERVHHGGRIASLLGVEGGHSIGNSLAVLRQAYALGARYMTLTHWTATDWADAATSPARHNGLTRFGREVVREMNRLGMMVDLAHVSDQTMLDAIAASEAPVIFSHSSARALCNHPRNVSDEILRKVAATGGVVMVNFAPGFISDAARLWDEKAWPERERLRTLMPGSPDAVRAAFAEWKRANPAPHATLAQVADHVDHIREVAGIDCVGLGSDFDGISTTPDGLEDVSRYPELIAELLRRGYSAEDVRKVAGGNLLRVMRRAEEVASRLQRERPPSDALIEELDPKPATAEHAPGGSH